MRLRAGLMLFVFALLAAVGCRKPLAPNVDRNDAPETWITAAPQDTITQKDENGVVIVPKVGTVPVRFHVYWAGSDRDGEVAGFYYAVTETIPVPMPGLTLPGVPGPKPQDYRFTTKTDTTFIFNVSEFRNDRQHAFFIYAVDNKGKADPTPARFIFNALDRFPPAPYILEARAVGPVHRMLPDRSIDIQQMTVAITDTLPRGVSSSAPRDTVPAVSELTFRWRGEPTIEGTYVVGYRYKLDDPDFGPLTQDTVKVYPRGVVAPGSKVFTLRAVDQAGGAEFTTRRFQMNFSPDTWFAGPDPNQFPVVRGERVIDLSALNANWSKPSLRMVPQLQNTLLSIDSLRKLPAERPQRKTFYEFYGNKIYIRSEGDTVNMNSWVVFHSGGLDVDSPYDVAVQLNDPALVDTLAADGNAPVVRPSGPNGSPIGFQFLYWNETTPFQSPVPQTLSGLYPVFDAARVDQASKIAAYVPASTAGQIFLATRAVDGHEQSDRRIPDPRAVVKAGPQHPLYSRVIHFFVNKPPRLDFNRPGFVPRPDTTFFSRTNIKFNLFAVDDDPYTLDPAFRPEVGGPAQVGVLRWTVRLRGKAAGTGNDTTVALPGGFRFNEPALSFNMPDAIVSEDVYAEIELCDCDQCEVSEGSGRCVNLVIHFRVPPLTPQSQSLLMQGPRPGPGSSSGRSTP